MSSTGVLHMRAGGVSLVLDCRQRRLPRVLHWGADLGDLDRDELENLALATVPPVGSGEPDEPVPLALLPEDAAGWPGVPGLTGHRAGQAWAPLFSVESLTQENPADESLARRLVANARDPVAALALRLEIEMTRSGLVRLRGALGNLHEHDVYELDGLLLALPVPLQATELLDLTGRHTRERVPQRQPFNVGSRMRGSRRGRTGFEASLVLAAGTAGFDFRHGQVWAIHVAWSGNHRIYAERLPSGVGVIGGGELLLPGEVRLDPGEAYESPWIYASYGAGLDDVSARWHDYLRSRPNHPTRPRPVVLNTWEAVFFDHNLERLTTLADRAAEVGVERFVLDDGWFRNRRDDRAGLGDWYVDETVWPKGLHPLIDHVRELGMEFGLWVEPEMINPNSDLARRHPDWLLATGGRRPPLARSQQVLNIGDPDAFAYVLERLDELLKEYDIAYLKWDHNRDLIDAGRRPGGEPGVRTQTLAVYALLDELRLRHPSLEIESCASGGGRVDLGILERTDRVWASDCNDALERQTIQRWTGLLLAPELIGAHVGAPRSHTTGRSHDLSFRAGTALFGHFGIEWDIAGATSEDRQQLAQWIVSYKELRELLHTGRVVRGDHPDPALWVHGVVAQDKSEAVFAVVAMTTGVCAPPGHVRLPGLDPDVRYRVTPLPPADVPVGFNASAAGWLRAGGITLSGRVLADVGLQAPNQFPEQLMLLRVTAAS